MVKYLEGGGVEGDYKIRRNNNYKIICYKFMMNLFHSCLILPILSTNKDQASTLSQVDLLVGLVHLEIISIVLTIPA